MPKVKFIFEVDDVRMTKHKTYSYEPTREQIEADMKDWFFKHCGLWFSYTYTGEEIFLGEEE